MFIKEFGCTGLFPFSLVLFCFFIVFLSEKRAIAFVPGMIVEAKLQLKTAAFWR